MTLLPCWKIWRRVTLSWALFCSQAHQKHNDFYLPHWKKLQQHDEYMPRNAKKGIVTSFTYKLQKDFLRQGHTLAAMWNSSFKCICYCTSWRKHTITWPPYCWQLLLISTNLSGYLISVKVPNAFFVFFFLTHTNPSISHNDISPFTGMIWISRIFNWSIELKAKSHKKYNSSTYVDKLMTL